MILLGSYIWGSIFLAHFMFWLAVILLKLIARYKIFVKAGRDGILSIIPIYNWYELFHIAGMSGWWMFLLLCPFLNVVVYALFCLNLAEKYGKSKMFALGLLFFNTIFTLILGFDSSQYKA